MTPPRDFPAPSFLRALPSSQETKLRDGQVLTPLVGSTPWLCFPFSLGPGQEAPMGVFDKENGTISGHQWGPLPGRLPSEE